MAENVTLARPYAEAVFELARDSGQLAAWAEVLERVAMVAADPAAKAFLGSPGVTAAQATQLLADASGASLSTEQTSLLHVLVENRRAQLLPEIRDLFVLLKNAHDGVKDAVVSSAFPIDAAALASLTADLEAHFKSRLNVSVQIDPELIGGVRVAVGDEVVDASVRGKLAAMAAALQN